MKINEEYARAYWVANPFTPNEAITIDPETCIGCKRCINACRTDVLLPALTDSKPPCTKACPAGIDIKRQLALIARGQYLEALQVIKESIPLPLACSRVCPRFCEKKCGRSGLEGPVAINMTKRFVADLDLKRGGPAAAARKPASGKRVAVGGSGPAGLSAAYYLALEGHAISIFEARQKAGGLLRYGVPDHRLPKNILDREIASILEMCEKVQTGTSLGRDFTVESLLKEGFAAVFLAVGAQAVLRLNVEGEDLNGVQPGVEFLRELNSGRKPVTGKRVVLVGGGMVAVDAAQSVLRMGAEEVTVVCLESRESMPAYREDVALAEEEGIKILNGWGIERIAGAAGKVTGIELKACSSVYDRNGRFSPVYDEKKTQKMAADNVIVCIGQTPDLSFLGKNIKTGRVIEVDSEYATNKAGVFAAGDVVSGPKTVIEACAGGHAAAQSIHRYLQGQTVTSVQKAFGTERAFQERQEYADIELERTVMPVLSVEERRRSFAEIELGAKEEEVKKEASRCFACGQQPVITYPDECWFCGACVEVCPVEGAISLNYPLNQRVIWKRKATGEFFRIGMKNPPPPNTRPPIR